MYDIHRDVFIIETKKDKYFAEQVLTFLFQNGYNWNQESLKNKLKFTNEADSYQININYRNSITYVPNNYWLNNYPSNYYVFNKNTFKDFVKIINPTGKIPKIYVPKWKGVWKNP